jgi:hypothetical protein
MTYELTDTVIDAPRDILLGIDMHIRQTAAMRRHVVQCGGSILHWPDWAKYGDQHITKAGIAILIWTVMEHARRAEADEAGDDPSYEMVDEFLKAVLTRDDTVALARAVNLVNGLVDDEGWAIFENNEHGFQIEADHMEGVFERDGVHYDDEALAFVRVRARQGSRPHLLALKLVDEPPVPEEQALVHSYECGVCGSKGFQPSVTGKGCAFCDGTEGGNPPERLAEQAPVTDDQPTVE